MSKKDKILKLINFFSKKAFEKQFKKEIREINNKQAIKELSNLQKREINEYYSGFGFSRINTDWHKFYFGIISKFDKRFIPKDIFYSKIESSLNRSIMYPAYLDKNVLSNLFTFVRQPKTIIKNINNFYYSNSDELINLEIALEITSNYKKIVIKPSIHSGGGKNVQLFEISNLDFKDRIDSLRKLFNGYHKDFIIQEVIEQDNQMKLLNESSVNTVRVISYLKGTDVFILSSVVRIGNVGKFTDNNSHLGGISCGIDFDGKLKEVGYNDYGTIYHKSDFGCILKSFEIPQYDKMLILVKRMHKLMPNFRLISWDLAIDNTNEIVLIEINLEYQGLEMHQLNNGPLFRELTEEVLFELMKSKN